MAHDFDISKLTGRLQQLAILADTDHSNHIDTEAEYSLFENYAKSDLNAGIIAESDYKGIFGLETTTSTEEVQSTETPQAATVTNPITVSKKETERDQKSVKNAVKEMVKQGVSPQNLIAELKTKYTNPQYSSIINEVQEVLNIVNGTNYNSKEDVEKIHDTAKKALKAAGKWDSFHKDILGALEDQAKENQINKEFKVLVEKYNEVKAACTAQGLAPNFEEYVNTVEADLEKKGNDKKKPIDKSYTKAALKRLKEFARKEAMGVQESKLEDTEGTSARKIKKEMRAQNTTGDAYQNRAIKDLKTERKVFARKNHAEDRAEELSHLNTDSLISELGKRSAQFNFVKKASAHKIGRNIYDKLKNKYLETIKNEDGTYDLSKLQADLLNYVGQDYKVNQGKDKQMSEMFNIKVRLKDLTGEDWSDNETKVLLNVLGFDREHRDHLPKLGRAIVSGIGGALGGKQAVGTMRQVQSIQIVLDNSLLTDISKQLKNSGVEFSTTELTKGRFALNIFQEQIKNPGVVNALKGAGLGILTSAMLDIIIGNGRDEKSCFSVSDYNKDDPTYTNPEKYKQHFANTTKNKAKIDAMNILVDAYVEKYGENWHSELHNTILKTAGIGSKMNPEECRVLRFQKPDEKPVQPPVQPDEKPPVQPDENSPEPKEQCGVDMDEQKVDTTYTHRRKGGDTWGGIVKAYYPCLVEEKGLSGAIRALKIALATDENGNLNKATYQALLKGSDLPRTMNLPAKIGDCDRVDNAQVKRVRVHGGGKAKIEHVGSKSGYTQYTATDGCDDRQKATGRTKKEALKNLKDKTHKTYTNEADYQK